LQVEGIRLIRFTNKDVNEAFEAVCEQIERTLKSRP
jgi:very-short-patch-repair endonuclease